MNITHDDTATSWRDLTDQLTPEQVRRFEHFAAMALNAKRDAAPDEHDTADELLTGLLTEPRREAQHSLTDAMIGWCRPYWARRWQRRAWGCLGAGFASAWSGATAARRRRERGPLGRRRRGQLDPRSAGARPHGGRVRRGGVTLGDTDAGRCGEVVALRPPRGS